MTGEKQVFEGVIIGFEEERRAVIIQGSSGDYSGEITVFLSEEDFDKIKVLGIGQMIRGVGEAVAGETGLIIRNAHLEG